MFLHQSTNRKPDITGKRFDSKNNISNSCIINPIIRKFKQSLAILIYVQPKYQSESFPLRRTIQLMKSSLWFMQQIRDSQNVPKKNTFLFRSVMFKLSILSHYQFNFRHQDLNRKNITCTRVINWKILVFYLASYSWLLEISKDNLSILVFSRDSNSFSPKPQAFFVPPRLAWKNF